MALGTCREVRRLEKIQEERMKETGDTHSGKGEEGGF